MKAKLSKFLKNLTPGQVVITVLFVWFILVCIIIPIINFCKEN